MKDELIVYTTFITDPEKSTIKLEDYVLPVEGLHLLVSFAADGTPDVQVVPFRAPKKKGERPDMKGLLQDQVLPRTLHIDYVDSNKAIADKKIHSASPYALKLKKQVLLDKAWMSDFAEHVARYFREALKKCRADHTSAQREQVAAFVRFCQRLPERLAEWPEAAKEYEKLKPADYVVLYAADFTPAEFRVLNQNYQDDSLFNKNDYNVQREGATYGLSNFYNGDNSKKPYLQHQTASFSIGSRISQTDARALHLFNQLRRYGAFSTNPLPVFLDKPELNLLLVNTIRQEGKQAAGFHELLQTLCEKRPSDVGNYYLFYILGGDIRDVDYVSAFRYELEASIVPIFGEEKHGRLRNVFELEKQLLQPLFGNQLVMRIGEGAWRYRYFDDLDFDPKYQTPVQYEAIMRYRGAWYDYIYKSRRQAVSREMFHQSMQELVLDDLRHDEWDASQRRHTREYAIRQKLNRWFSLWDFFDQTTLTPTDMPNQIEALRERIRAVANTPDAPHVATDTEFGFAAGQVIYAILRKSKADNPTHGLLEPFLQKSAVSEFRRAIATAFDIYKHEFDFGQGRLEKLCADVMEYDYAGNVKELMPHILAGYFSKSLIYEKKEKETATTTQNA
jgi:CRISPR-associated protein Csh1